MRINYYSNICKFNEIVATNVDLFYYLPENPALDEGELDIRSCKVMYLESKACWYQNNPDFSITRVEECDNFAQGIWIMDKKDEQTFNTKCPSVQLVENITFEDYKIYRVNKCSDK